MKKRMGSQFTVLSSKIEDNIDDSRVNKTEYDIDIGWFHEGIGCKGSLKVHRGACSIYPKLHYIRWFKEGIVVARGVIKFLARIVFV